MAWSLAKHAVLIKCETVLLEYIDYSIVALLILCMYACMYVQYDKLQNYNQSLLTVLLEQIEWQFVLL